MKYVMLKSDGGFCWSGGPEEWRRVYGVPDSEDPAHYFLYALSDGSPVDVAGMVPAKAWYFTDDEVRKPDLVELQRIHAVEDKHRKCEEGGSTAIQFIPGKWYKWVGPRDYTINWNNCMEAWKDGQPRRCNFEHESRATFDGIDGGAWFYGQCMEHFQEVEDPKESPTADERIQETLATRHQLLTESPLTALEFGRRWEEAGTITFGPNYPATPQALNAMLMPLITICPAKPDTLKRPERLSIRRRLLDK